MSNPHVQENSKTAMIDKMPIGVIGASNVSPSLNERDP
jgi:hypothetical protein